MIKQYFSLIDIFLKEKAAFNDTLRKTWIKKQQDIIHQTDSLSLKLPSKNELDYGSDLKSPFPRRKLSIKSKLIEKKIQINIINSTEEDFKIPKNLTHSALSISNPLNRFYSTLPKSLTNLDGEAPILRLNTQRTLTNLNEENPPARSLLKSHTNLPETLTTLSVAIPLVRSNTNLNIPKILTNLNAETPIIRLNTQRTLTNFNEESPLARSNSKSHMNTPETLTIPLIRSSSTVNFNTPKTLIHLNGETPLSRSNSKPNFNTQKTLTNINGDTPIARSNSKANLKDSIYLFDFDDYMPNHHSKRLNKNPSNTLLLPHLSTCSSTLNFADAENTPTMSRSNSNINIKVSLSGSNSPKVLPKNLPGKNLEDAINLKRFVKRLQLSPIKPTTEADRVSSYGFVDIFHHRNHQKTPMRVFDSPKTDRSEKNAILENNSLLSMIKCVTGKELVSKEKLVVLKTARSKSHSKPHLKLKPISSERSSNLCSAENSRVIGDSEKTSNKGSMSARQLNFNLESIKRVDHEYVESNQLLSLRLADKKIIKSKHNMFRTIKHN